MANCIFIKPDGNPCEANSLKGSDYCFSHDPTTQEAKLLAVTKGGLNRKLYEVYGEPLTLEEPSDIKKLLSNVINGIWTGTIPASQPANSIGFLSRCWLDAYQISEIENRLKSIEEKLTKAHL